MNLLIEEFKKLNSSKRVRPIAEVVYLHTNLLKEHKEKDINDDNNYVSSSIARLKQNESPNNIRLRLNISPPLAPCIHSAPHDGSTL